MLEGSYPFSGMQSTTPLTNLLKKERKKKIMKERKRTFEVYKGNLKDKERNKEKKVKERKKKIGRKEGWKDRVICKKREQEEETF